MQAPMIHLNGSGKENLRNAYYASIGAMNDALNILRQNRPHMRDYYLYPNGGTSEFRQATKEHLNREERLNENVAEIEALLRVLFK